MRRRSFLGATLGTLVTPIAGCASSVRRAAVNKTILVLGGTNYVGPAIVERATARGHEVTLFNRGITRPHLFPELEKLRGDRRLDGSDLAALAGARRWDAVIDVWPAESGLVEQTARLLADRTDYYFFCSSIAVYTDFGRAGLDETSPTHDNDPGWYGGEKALAEGIVERTYPGAFGVSRCHAILGPRDDGASFHYWLRRLALNDDVLAPGSGGDPVQYVDVRDVARWIIDCVERRRLGTHNLCGPVEPRTMRSFLEGSRNAIGSRARLVWVDADFLRAEQGVASFSDMPLWAPLDEDAGFYQIDGGRAVAAGLKYRPLAETARDAWRWYQSHFFRETVFPLAGLGLSRDRELEVLAAWRARSGAA